MGLGGIHPRILKDLADVTVDVIPFIFQWSWESEELSLSWKLANIVQVFKDKKEVPGDFRPVSLIAVKLWRKLFWELLKNTQETTWSLVTVSTSSWGKILLKQLKFIHMWLKKVRKCGFFLISARVLVLSVIESFWINGPVLNSTSPMVQGMSNWLKELQ